MASNETTSRPWRRPLQVFQNQKTHDQHSSLFFRLPPEIRDAVYLALVENAGGSQHIVLHEGAAEDPEENSNTPHFCSWPCITEYDVEGDDNPYSPNNECRKSRWHNHWRCEAAMLQACAGEGEAVDGPCRARRQPTGYLSMMLACRQMYWELSPVIYANTRFVFTDVVTYQMFMGVCSGEADNDDEEEKEEKEKEKGEEEAGQREEPHNPPPQFMQHARELELSMSIEFPMQILCSAELEAGLGKHSAYDFHWMQLDKLAGCRKVNLWIAFDRPLYTMFYGRYITDKSPDFLRKSLAAFAPADRVQVTLSTPLSMYIGPLQACGVVDELSRPNVQVWKRDNYVVDINPTDDVVIGCTFGDFDNSEIVAARDRLLRYRIRRLRTTCWTRVKDGLAGLKNWKK